MEYKFYFQLSYPLDIHAKIKFKKSKSYSPKKEFVKRYDELITQFKKSDDDIQRLFNEINLFKHNIVNDFFYELIPMDLVGEFPTMVFNTFDIKLNKTKPYFFNLGVEYREKSYKMIKTNVYGEIIYQKIKNLPYCKRMETTYLLHIKNLYYLFEYLQIGGYYFTAMHPCGDKQIEYYYLLSLFFEKIIMIDSLHILCLRYRGELVVTKKELEEIICKKVFYIEPKPKIHDLIKYMNSFFVYECKFYEYLLNKKKKQLYELVSKQLLICLMEINPDHHHIMKIDEETKKIRIENKKIKFNLIKDYKTENKKSILLLKKYINKKKAPYEYESNILEIGMGLGIFTNIILESIEKSNFNFIIIDPYQKIIWNDIGLNQIKKLSNIEIFNESYITSLPKIVNQRGSNYFNIIFIHQYDKFDKMMYLLFFCKVFLQINGYLIFMKSAYQVYEKIIDFIDTNYLFLKKIEEKDGLMIYQKISEDQRLEEKNMYLF